MATNESGIDSDLIRGHIDTIILKALFEGDKYGYEICKEVEERSGGTYELKQPTLYSCLKRLESQKLISSYWTDSEIGGKRHYYKLTDLGKETYEKNQDDWNRSRVIIDSLISNGEKPQFIISETSKKEIDELQKQVEDLKKQLEEEKQNKPEVEEKIVYVPSEPETKIVYVPVSDENSEPHSHSEPLMTDETVDFVPWKENETDDLGEDVPSFAEIIEEKEKEKDFEVLNEDENDLLEDENAKLETGDVVPEVQQEGEQLVKYVQLSDNFIAKVASNGEILSVEKAPLKTEEESTQPEEEPQSPAQASVFEEQNDESLVFDEEDDSASESDFDIMALLGHSPKQQVEYSEKQLIETSNDEQLLISKQVKPELEHFSKEQSFKQSSSPFEFKVDEDFDVSDSFFDASEKEVDEFYDEPIEKIDGKEIKQIQEFSEDGAQEEVFDEHEEEETHEDEGNSDEEISSATPIYHNFGVTNKNVEEADLTSLNLDDIYENPDKNEDEKPDQTYSLFDEDDLVEDNGFAETEEQKDVPSLFEEETTFDDSSVQEKPMPFYEPTENYDSMQTNYTDEKYKEKLSSLMSYQATDGVRENYKILVSPKEFKDLKEEFEEEGIIVKPHFKMVKESKSTRSYVESNKLNVVNSWTAFGIVAFLVSLTFLIMNNYKSEFSTYDFSAKYFLIGLGILMVVPLTYSAIYFVNPYKKKIARYAYRIYILFALLLTIQFLIIIYSVNLQLGFYSIHQENYNHLYWIVPTILSFYPLIDAILHGVYFSSHSFHI